MTTTAAPPRVNPYPGLRPFGDDEEDVFFGRERQVDRMIDTLAAHRFLAVVGMSGSGKSSLVNCGLRPALSRGLLAAAGSAWRVAKCRPGADPIRALAHALAAPGVLFDEAAYAEHAASGGDAGMTIPDLVDATLRVSSLGVADIFEQARLDPAVNLLVVVDQFEELFRYRALAGAAPAAAAAFVKLLLEARRHPRVYVVLTMRSDFLGECAQFDGLSEAINDGQYLVPRLTRDETRAAIEGPAGVVDSEIAPVLVTRVLNDVGDSPDQLSLLQHALNRTWAHWRETTGDVAVEIASYEAVGTIADALDRHAEETFAALPTGLRAVCERVFRALTDRGTDARGIRRPTPFATLVEIVGAPADDVRAVVEAFREPSRSFLMPPPPEPLLPDTVVDISHESLMRTWSRLRGWVADEAESAGDYRRLADSARRRAEGRATYWRDADLRNALAWRRRQEPNAAWAAQYGGDLAQATAFLGASLDQEVDALADDEVARRWAPWRRAIGAVVAIAFALVTWIGVDAEELNDVFAVTLTTAFAIASYFGVTFVGKHMYRYRTRYGIVSALRDADADVRVVSKAYSQRVRLRHRTLAVAGATVVAIVVVNTSRSWLANRDLTIRVNAAEALVAAVPDSLAPGATFPPVDVIRRLDALRAVIDSVQRLDSDPSWRMRWGMWRGRALALDARLAWVNAFDWLLGVRAWGTIVNSLSTLAPIPEPTDDYGRVYGWLKAYLVRTHYPDSARADFMAPVLLDAWRRDQPLDPELAALARRQFEFYVATLARGDVRTDISSDSALVSRARAFLAAFSVADRVYASMLAAASKSVRPARRPSQPVGMLVLTGAPDVPGAFTPEGWTFMQDAFRNANRYFQGERWVVGDAGGGPAHDTGQLLPTLRALYRADYEDQWRAFLRSLAVVRPASLDSAAKILGNLGAPQSPLVAALDLVARNTVADSGLAAAFQPVHAVAPADSAAGRPAAPYLAALTAFAESIDDVRRQPSADGAARAAQTAMRLAARATTVARALEAGFNTDTAAVRVGPAVAALLETPITSGTALIAGIAAGASASASSPARRPTVVVVPFADGSVHPSAADASLAARIADLMITELAAGEDVRVVDAFGDPRLTVEYLTSGAPLSCDPPPRAPPTAPLPDLAVVGAYIVDHITDPARGRARVDARIVELATRRVLFVTSAFGRVDEVPALVGQLLRGARGAVADVKPRCPRADPAKTTG